MFKGRGDRGSISSYLKVIELKPDLDVYFSLGIFWKKESLRKLPGLLLLFADEVLDDEV